MCSVQNEHTINPYLHAFLSLIDLSNTQTCLTSLRASWEHEGHPKQDHPCDRRPHWPKEHCSFRIPHRSCPASVVRGSYNNKFPYITTRSLGSNYRTVGLAKTLGKETITTFLKPTNVNFPFGKQNCRNVREPSLLSGQLSRVQYYAQIRRLVCAENCACAFAVILC